LDGVFFNSLLDRWAEQASDHQGQSQYDEDARAAARPERHGDAHGIITAPKTRALPLSSRVAAARKIAY
jgi:hypothetical protein